MTTRRPFTPATWWSQAQNVFRPLFRHYIDIPPAFLPLPDRSALPGLRYSNQIINTTRTAHSRRWS